MKCSFDISNFLEEISAAAKSLQLCPTLCDPIDGSPPGSPFPGILQARTLEWVAISFSKVWKWKVKVKSLSRVQIFATPWITAYQAPPCWGCFTLQNGLIELLNNSLKCFIFCCAVSPKFLLFRVNSFLLPTHVFLMHFSIWWFSTRFCGVTILNNTTTTTKLLQSCPTLCDPIEGSPPGSPVSGILQARILEWVAISFSSA